MREEINRLFESALMGLGLESSSALPAGAWLPPMDVVEEDDHFQFLVELPGVEADQIQCAIRDGVLEILRQPCSAALRGRELQADGAHLTVLSGEPSN